jgi:hypothetical protein
MRKNLLLVLLMFFSPAQAQSSQEHWRLLISGDYHGDEAPTKPGIGWLALIPLGGVWRLEPALVRAKPVFDVVLDAKGQTTGIQITSNRADAIALLRFQNVKPGKVDTPSMTFKDTPRSVSSGDPPLRIPFKGEQYLIQADKGRVYLHLRQSKAQLPDLLAADGDNENSASLLWAGDLDGDGRLDLLFAYNGNNRAGVCLYLSAAAAEGELVQRAACHGGIGC